MRVDNTTYERIRKPGWEYIVDVATGRCIFSIKVNWNELTKAILQLETYNSVH